jgi:pyridoxal 5'-phosphate synthase pdxT subunit
MVTGPVGVLALQGGYLRHEDMLTQLGLRTRKVRAASHLHGCTALVLPGGESTAITQLLQDDALFTALQTFARRNPVLGTCAGLILMGRVDDARVRSLGLLDARIARNAYGRQTQSFQCALEADLGRGREQVPGLFIRAPQIVQTGPGVTVLARHNGAPVLIAQGHHMGASFHPELTGDLRVHRRWLEQAARDSAAPYCAGASI